jgi:hypothetical protein
MLTITFKQTDPIAVRGMPFRTGSLNELVSVSQELKDLGCPDSSYDAAVNWTAFTHKVRFLERHPSKLISRTQRELTIVFEPASAGSIA